MPRKPAAAPSTNGGAVAELAAPDGASPAVRQQFDQAVEQLVERARGDPYIQAVILFGSLSHDTVWEKSDIDLLVIRRDESEFFKGKTSQEDSIALTENGLNIHAMLYTRSKFKRAMEGATTSSFFHSMFAKSRLLFTRDEVIREWYDNIAKLGSHDRQAQLLRAATWVVPLLYKAQKWLRVKKDVHYAFHWLLHAVTPLAQIECYLDNQLAGREVIQQALVINPRFFRSIYTDLIDKKKTAKLLEQAIEAVDGYLTRKQRVLFGPVLEYLKKEGSMRSASEIDQHFRNQMNLTGVPLACEWLADKEIVVQASTPVRLTKQSRVEFQEIAFYYDGEGHHG